MFSQMKQTGVLPVSRDLNKEPFELKIQEGSLLGSSDLKKERFVEFVFEMGRIGSFRAL